MSEIQLDSGVAALANSIPQLAWIADSSGSINWYNDRWYAYTGTTLDQMRGWGWRACHHPDHVDRVVERISHSFQTGEPWEDTFPLRSADGEYRWFLSRALPVRNAAGDIKHWFGTNTDISKERENAEFLNRVLESSSDCIKVLDQEGHLLSMNDRGKSLMEIDDFSRFEGASWLDLWKGPHEHEARAAIEDARRGRIGRFRGVAPTAKGTPRWWDVRVTPINSELGVPEKLLSVSRDITAERQIELSVMSMNTTLTKRVDERTALLEQSENALRAETGVREAAEAQVRQLQKMEAVGLLAGGIAHDFNNMLAVIIGGLNIIERRLAKGQEVKQYIDGAIEGANRAASLTQRLLAFSKQLPLAPETIDPNRLVSTVSEMLRRTLGEAVVIETVLSGGLWKTSADIAQLESAILNLAINARDAMTQGGKLTLETANAHLDEQYAREHVDVTPGQYVMIAVSDTGTGMSLEVVARAFEPFFTTKGVGKGTGLGLSQVYGFVKQSKGHVKIYSEPDQGTTVKVYLPRLYGEQVVANIPKKPPAPLGTLADVVLLVEDEDRIRDIGSAGLRELGYTVMHADSAQAALRILESHPQVTVLFTDVVMPGMNGRQLADEALRIRPDLKVLFTTGYTRNAIVHGGVLDAGVNFLPKPFTLDQLAQKLHDVIQS